MRLSIAIVGAFLIVTAGRAETLLSEAKVVKVQERGFIFQVGTQPLAVEDSYETRFWRDKKPVKREAFLAGDPVAVRIKTDADPPQLREMADKATQTWLEAIRRDFKKGSIEKVDPKFVTIKFDDGSSFAYRATDKSKVTLKGKSAALSGLDEGMIVYAKGRLLPTLDTFLVEITDVAPPAPVAKSKSPEKGPKAKLTPLKPDGLLEGTVSRHHPEISMFDIEADRMLHITYSASTKFTLDGQSVGKDAIRPRLRARIAYKRDKAGRILASRVDLFTN